MPVDDRSERPPSLRPASEEDIVADRGSLLVIGMAAVFVACVVFGALRFAVHVATGLATPWWGNAVGAVAIALLYAWHRRDPKRSSSIVVHGTALVATVALLIPAAYGMTSSKWWLSLVGFSTMLMARRREAVTWAVVTLILVPATALVEPWIRVPDAIGEPPAERAVAGLVYVSLLLGVTWAFRRASERRAKELAATAASLDRANRVKSRFLAHMSHEIRTPLHGVIAMTDLAQMGEAATDVHQQIDSAQQSARVLLGLLNNLLDVSRAEADALELDRRSFRVHAALTDVLRPLAAQANARGLGLQAHAQPGIAAVRTGDRVRVGQIVMNLVGNALKFTTTGRISVELRRVDEDDDLLEIVVSDTGSGIRPDQLSRIFEPFAQAEAGDAQRQGGAGLGLAIVRELATAMGGGARVESSVGRGSTFFVKLRLPRDLEHAGAGEEDLLPPAPAVSDSAPARARRTLRVLACEDNPVNQHVLRVMLKRLEHDATIVSDGEAAWAQLQKESFDVVLTDVEMPIIDGIELTHRIRAREEQHGGRRLRVVGATAHVGEAERHRLLAEDMDAHLPKPFTLAQLSAALDLPAESMAPPEAGAIAVDAPVLVTTAIDALLASATEPGPLLHELMGRFRGTVESLATHLTGPGFAEDRATTSRLAHSVRGAATTLGLPRIAEIARRIEVGEGGDDRRESGLVEALGAELAAAEAALAAAASRSSPPS